MSDMPNLPHGPAEYIIERCPYCGRRLVEYHHGATHLTALHPKAGMRMSVDVPHNTKAGDTIMGSPVPGTAYCLRRMCRFRAWLHARWMRRHSAGRFSDLVQKKDGGVA